MNLTQEVREKIQLLSPGQRISHYLKMLVEKKITKEVYDDILEAIKSVPYIPANKENGTVGTDTRQTDDVRELEQTGSAVMDQSGERCVQTGKPASEERSVTQVEFVDSFSLPLGSDGTVRTGQSVEVEDKSNSQKQRLLTLLSDYEWHDTPSIQVAVYGANHLGVARIAARCNDLKQDGHDIESKKITQAIWSYRLVEKGMRWISENVGSG